MKILLKDYLLINSELNKMFIHDQEDSNIFLNYTVNSNKKPLWLCMKCSQNHRTPIVRKVKNIHSGCGVCAGVVVIPGVNDFAHHFPELCSWWSDKNDKKPYEISRNSRYLAIWKCPVESHPEWEARVDNIANGHRCRMCATSERTELYKTKKKSKKCERGLHNIAPKRKQCKSCLEEFDCLAVTHPELTKELVDFNIAKTITFGSAKKALWRCKNEHQWESCIYSRTSPNKPTGCPYCSNSVSLSEQIFVSTVEKYLNTKSLRNSRAAISPYEIDMYFPDHKVGIEFNGAYWHSEIYRNKNYHYDKYRIAKEKGITLIQIWDTQWNENQEVILRMIAHKMKLSSSNERVFARNTFVNKISLQEAKTFLDYNHIQGFTPSCKYYALYHRGEIVSVMTFKKNMNEYILNRYATSKHVIGGFSKLLKFFTEANTAKRIVSFSDNLISDGNLYENTGFDRKLDIAPDYQYYKDGKMFHRFQYRIECFKNDVNLRYAEVKSESELAKMNNLIRVWDAGKVMWVLELDSQQS